MVFGSGGQGKLSLCYCLWFIYSILFFISLRLSFQLVIIAMPVLPSLIRLFMLVTEAFNNYCHFIFIDMCNDGRMIYL